MWILSETMGDSVFFDRHISYLGDYTWSSMSGRRVQLKPVPVQSLSELERVRLQDVAFSRLSQDYGLGCQITIPRDGQNHKKSLRKKLDSFAKEKNKDKEFAPQVFGVALWQVIANDRSQRQRQAPPGPPDPPDLVSSLLQFSIKRPSKELSSSNSSLGSSLDTPIESPSPGTPETAPPTRRRGGMSVDSITDLDDSRSRLLEALQLSLPPGGARKKDKHRDEKLSLNPIYRLVPRLVDRCCHHLERHGMQTVGIFRVGSSKKRVRQLREEFDRGVDVLLDEDHSVHDVAALLKEFLRDMPDPLLTKELYTAFINTMLLEREEQLSALQLLVYLLPPCNSDTLHRLLDLLSTVASHAHDTRDQHGQEVAGNKMTSLNLATILGPNVLHKQKISDKEFSVQSSARAEESAAVIGVLQRMISAHDALYVVTPDLQNEVLGSLLETDPDVVDYLLRRKASQWLSSDTLSADVPFSLSERRSSSGEISPYDNTSPVLTDSFLQGEGSPGVDRPFHPTDRHTANRHTVNRHTPDRHTVNRHTPDTHTPDRHTLNRHTPDTHTPDRHTVNRHTPDTHTPDRHTVNRHTVNRHTPDRHTPDRHTVNRHPPDTHTPDRHTPDRHTLNTHTPDRHTPDRHTLDTHTLDTHTPDRHTLDRHTLDRHTPDTHTLDTHIPDRHTPDRHTLDTHTPDRHTPDRHIEGSSTSPGSAPRMVTCSHRKLSRRVSCSPLDGLCDHTGNRKQPLQRTQTSSHASVCGPHPLVTHGNRSPQAHRGYDLNPDPEGYPECSCTEHNPDLLSPQQESYPECSCTELNPDPPLQQQDGYPECSCTEDLPQRRGLPETPPCFAKPAFRNNDVAPPPRPGPRLTPSPCQPGAPQPHRGPLQCRDLGPQGELLQCRDLGPQGELLHCRDLGPQTELLQCRDLGPQTELLHCRDLGPQTELLQCRDLGPQGELLQTPASPVETRGPEWQGWQRDRWKIWQLLSLDSTDSLPETLV